MTENNTDGVVIQNGKRMALYKVLLLENGNVLLALLAKKANLCKNNRKENS
jgi:hypothetical protein